jgi:transcriptional regulator with XRE-family HTH domain
MSRPFGEKLRYLRNRRGISQTELAQQLQLASHSHVNNLEAGRREPSLDLVIRAARLFEVTTDYLLRDAVPTEMIAIHRPVTSNLPEEQPRYFGQKLRYLRKQQKLTQMELAARLQLRTQAHISLLESARSEPSIEFAIQLADFFGVSTDYLLCDDIPINSEDE